MLNAKLKKQIEFYQGKCWEYHNRMKFASDLKLTNCRRQYEKNNKKYYEVKTKIESDGKHKVIWGENGKPVIEEIQ